MSVSSLGRDQMSDVRKIREKSLRLQTYKIQLLHTELWRKKDLKLGELNRLECNYSTRRYGEKKDLKLGELNRLECNYSTRRYGEKKT
jgi:hypothetical protein